MDLTIREKAHQMKRLPSFLNTVNCRQQNLIAEKLASRDVVINSRNVHPNDASGADVQMSHFRIAYHSGGQTHARARSFQQCLRVVFTELVVIRSCGKGDSIPLNSRRISPTVNDY